MGNHLRSKSSSIGINSSISLGVLTAVAVLVAALVVSVVVSVLVAVSPTGAVVIPVVQVLPAVSTLVVLATGVLPIVSAGGRGVLRGGAWNTPFDEATCFSRDNATIASFEGFRCVKEIGPTQSP